MFDFLKKRVAQVTSERVTFENQTRMNPLFGITPQRMVSAIEAYHAGYLCDLSRILDEYEVRDDAIRSNSRKMYGSVGRCSHSVGIIEGFESDPSARVHQKILERFWATVRVSSAFCRNETGSIRLLKKQMARAIYAGYNVHEIVWHPDAVRKELRAEFSMVPLHMFESKTGALRFLPEVGRIDGDEMLPGEWLVTAGDGVGIAAAIAAMSKRLSLNDWLAFSERCGTPGLHAKTNAQKESVEWLSLVRSIASFGRNWSLLTSSDVEVKPINLNSGGTLPYPALVELMNQAIATLMRGGDLATVSAKDSIGAESQNDEKNLLEEDICEMISETLHEQVSRVVIRWHTGDDEPLAYLQIRPTTSPNITQEIQIDAHLSAHGVVLSGNDALARYGRTAYDPADAADFPLTAPAALPSPGALANEKPVPELTDEQKALATAFMADLKGIADILQSGKSLTDEQVQKLNAEIKRLSDGQDTAFAAELERILANTFTEAIKK